MPSVPKKGSLANNVDLDQTQQNAASDQGLHVCIDIWSSIKTGLNTNVLDIPFP